MPKFHTKLSSPTVPTLNVMVGVAGHIDHGKTELVKMLTGCDTDRLKEEKERGMSIELGYAPCFVESGRFGIVDVPGHERFVRKMVAAATGIDLALLVIAADDGVMPQTREHLDILELLGTRHLLIAVSKIDLVSPERVQEVCQEIQEFLLSTRYPEALITPVSSMTGDGLDVLRKRLQVAVDTLDRRKSTGIFRMAVDRIFSSHGHGTIITGIVSSGSVHVGDTVEVLPLMKSSRVRGLQVYLSDSEEGIAGQCVALNLPSIHPSEIERGFVAAEPGRFSAQTTFTVSLKASRFLQNPLPNAAKVHFHTGTSETIGKLRLLKEDKMEADEETYAQIFLEHPICAFLYDRFILRLPSPANTVAGGMILDIQSRRLKRNHEETLQKLQARERAVESHEELLALLLDDSPFVPQSVESLTRASGLQRKETEEALETLRQRSVILQKNESFILSAKKFQQACDTVLELLHNLHKQHPIRYAFSFTDIRKEWNEGEALLPDILTRLVDELKVFYQEGAYRAAGAPSLDPKLAHLAENLEDILRRERFQTSSPKQLAEQLRKTAQQVEAALRVLAEIGSVRRLADGIYLHEEHIQWAKNQLVDTLRREGSFETHLFKNLIGSSRKYAIPLLDYFDASGLTRREGGVRVLCEK